MHDTELRSRSVFIDTSAYEDKKFQFGQHSLKKVEQYINTGDINLLITTITFREIIAHLKKYSDEAVAKIKRVRNEAKFLRNTPELPAYGIFEEIKSDTVLEIVKNKFSTFINSGAVKWLKIDEINPNIIFEQYFAKVPPFDSTKKKSEFPDAFCLEAVNKYSQDTGEHVYIISKDGDMAKYASQHPNLIHLNQIDDFIDLVTRNSDELKEPAVFADSVFEQIKSDLEEKIIKNLEESEFTSDILVDFDDTVDDIDINGLSVIDKKIISVSDYSVEYEIKFEVNLDARYLISDYDRSPWDPEDHAYVFVFQNEIVKNHIESYKAYITIEYHDRIKTNAKILWIEYDDSTFYLQETNSTILSYEEKYFDEEE